MSEADDGVKAMSPASLRQHVSILAMVAVMVLSTVSCAQKTCKPMTCPQIPAKCVIVSARQKDGAGCLTRCEVLKCEPGVYSRDWKEVCRKLLSTISIEDEFREGLKEGLIISPEVKASPVPEGTYLFLDPVTRNPVFSVHRIVDPQ